jgi:endonuclease YncB( thermonuclease family)
LICSRFVYIQPAPGYFCPMIRMGRYERTPAFGLASATFVLGTLFGAAVFAAASGQRFAPARGPFRHAIFPPAPSRGPISSAGYPAEVLYVIDGDTFDARVLVWPGMNVHTRVRLRDIDAAEMQARCPQERRLAEAARDALRAILAQGDVGISRVGLDKYEGRVDADVVTRHTPNVSAAMLAGGYARPYDGGRRSGWC